jgi:hypothetical protein
MKSFGRKSLKEIEHLKDVGMDRRIILKFVVKKQDGRA